MSALTPEEYENMLYPADEPEADKSHVSVPPFMASWGERKRAWVGTSLFMVGAVALGAVSYLARRHETRPLKPIPRHIQPAQHKRADNHDSQ